MMKNWTVFLLFCALLISPVFAAWEASPKSDEISLQPQSLPLDDPESSSKQGPPVPGHMKNSIPDLTRSDRPQRDSMQRERPLLSIKSQDVIDLIQQMDEDLLLEYLEGVVAFGPRVTGSSACRDAAEYIYEEYQSMGLDVRYHDWVNSGYSGVNVEATIYDSTGTNDEIYIVCGHYDSVPGSPGADDNGSGTAAAMAIADIMSNYTYGYNIRFVNFSGEEQGLLGSEIYARDAYYNGDNIVAVLNADMIGYAVTQNDAKYMKVYNDTQSAWITNYMVNVSQTYQSHIDLTVIPSGYAWGSDHTSFNQYNYDAVFCHEYRFNDYYHSPQDIIANMNIPYYTKCSQLVLATMAEFVSPFERMPLTVDSHILSAQDGGILTFSLDGDTPNAFRDYYLIGSASGTDPGFLLPGGQERMPLNWDKITDLILAHMNTAVFSNFMGTLDADGHGEAQLNTLGPLPPTAVGVELNFAYACNKPWDFASNPTAVEIVD